MDKYSDLTRGQTAAICNKLGGMPGVKRLLADELIVTEKSRATSTEPRTMKVLRPIDPPAATEAFKADETFFAKKPGVKILYLGDNFRSWFAGTVEENPSVASPSGFNLTQSARDDEILEDRGGEASAAVALSQIWRLMQRQSSGEAGILLTNGYWNVFYCYDKGGVLRTVGVRWNGDGWLVYADALGHNQWNDGRRIFSRNS